MNCSYTLNFTTPFNIPDQCNQIVSAGKCSLSLDFSYDTRKYTVSFYADQSKYSLDNKHIVTLNLLSNTSLYFYYVIRHECRNKDDCARDFARNTALEMIQRPYEVPKIVNELIPLILGPPLTPQKSYVNCYDLKQNVLQCGNLTRLHSCVISHEIERNAMNCSCTGESWTDGIHVSIYQSNSRVVFNVECNRDLCNVNSTLQAVKVLMFKYNITKTLNGRLYDDSSRFIISISLIIMMIFALFLNQF